MQNRREEELIRLLIAGHTDSSAARRLKVSPRTITTMLRTLMDRMSVNNRFQLGVELGRHLALAEPVREREAVESP
jgi:DNA-binding NarL/FixJ family response regulator